MSSPVSSSLVEDALQCVVLVGVVGGVVLPAAPDDVGPGEVDDDALADNLEQIIRSRAPWRT